MPLLQVNSTSYLDAVDQIRSRTVGSVIRKRTDHTAEAYGGESSTTFETVLSGQILARAVHRFMGGAYLDVVHYIDAELIEKVTT